ncbi:hypothetical protein TSTA_013410 [Talaromyces stipitatus ATCC 10500]|uniref:BTB domain-containing protein n=1 Tax=Talaromyces stipitatus (strain ATCC 10500 / CBS 375.48 / QM 6759 / NRRL 1006) TaxID=441959 RepID=B8MGB8_TALSN|nr:uncharacterized protein TSTA_013410 [Talaromyces stipitatus ATCC 10500]EED16238.1 hypothetical protein TSTA_013410 [Talaromyces stipitatus ATCC 10500]
MSASRIIKSPLITFEVGEDKTPVKIHAAAVQNLSDPLTERICDEGCDGKAVTLEGVEDETFCRFMEFAYCAQHVQSAQHSNINRLENDGSARDPHRLYLTTPVARTILPAPNTSPFYRRFSKQFRSLEFNNVPAMRSVNPNIIFHTKLYVFATEFQVLSLRRQCLSKLHRDLCEFYMNPSDANLVLDLIEYVYTHTAQYELGEESPLRSLVFQYILCHIDKLVVQERFEEIVSRTGGLAISILREFLKAW